MMIYVNASFLVLENMTGISRFALEVCRKLKQNYGDGVTFLAPEYIYHKDIGTELNVKIISYKAEYIVKDTNKRRLIWEQTSLLYFLYKSQKPLLINLCNTAPIFYNNQIVSILDLFYVHIKELLPSQWKFYPIKEINFYKYIYSRITSRSKHIITISQYSKKDICTTYKVKSDNISVIYPELSSIFKNKTLSIKSRTESKFGKYILGVSSVNPHKNFHGLISSFLKLDLPDINLVIVGNLPQENHAYAVYKDYHKSNKIFFTGFIEDSELTKLYENAIFFCFPSFFEGFGIPPLEAMSCGCPTIVSSSASMPEVCGHASNYIDPNNLNDITLKMQQLVHNNVDREKLIENGFVRVEYLNDQIAKQYVSIFNIIDMLK